MERARDRNCQREDGLVVEGGRQTCFQTFFSDFNLETSKLQNFRDLQND
jgi:hypothetical protein